MFLQRKKPQSTERRSRTPQQSARSNAVFSYHASRSTRDTNLYRDAEREQRQESPRRQKRTSWLKKLPNIAALLGIIVFAAMLMQLSNNPKLETVGGASGSTFLRDKRVYVTAAQKAFAPWANSNKLTVNTEKISADLRKEFPELQAVSVSLPVVGTQPTVYIQPAVPRLLLVTKSGMFVLDINGRALITSDQVAKLKDLGVPVATDESGISIKTGDIALPKDTIDFISQVVGQLKAKGLVISSMTLPAGTNELHVKLNKVGYTVKFNLHGDAREEAGAFLAVKQQLEGQKKTPSSYIDVRVENKAYYQ